MTTASTPVDTLLAIILALSTLSLEPAPPATSRPAQEAIFVSAKAGESPVLAGTPHVPSGNHSAGEVRESAVGWHRYPDPVPGGVPLPSIGALLAAVPGSAPTLYLRSMPIPHSVQIADIRGWATYCAPTPTYCQRWGGDAHLGAVPSFRWGDEPYEVTVWHGERSTTVTVVSYCACGDRRGIPTVIDLSPAAFRELAPLSRGVIKVVIQAGREAPNARPKVTPPPTDTGGTP